MLASCAKEEVVEEEEEEEEEAVVEEEEEEEKEPAVGVPQYGGTLTGKVFHLDEAGTPDPHKYWWPACTFTQFVLQRFLTGDGEKYGPRGTDEYPFTTWHSLPFKYTKGLLAESWEVTPDKIVFHIRPGVYWAAMGKEHVMETREYIAHDFVFNLLRLLGLPYGSEVRATGFIRYDEQVVDGEVVQVYDEYIYAVDDYTVVVETEFFYSDWWLLLNIPSLPLSPGQST